MLLEVSLMDQGIKNWKMGKKIVMIGLFTAIFITTVSFSYKYYDREEKYCKLDEIEANITDVRGTMDLLTLRQQNIQKVIKIIELYNKDMSEKQKLAIANEINKMCLKYTNLNVDIICATITHESALTWQTDIVSPAGAMGLMQIMPETGLYLTKEEGITWKSDEEILFNPIYNIRLGCRYLSILIKQYEVDGALAAYNGGEERAKLWLKNRLSKTDWTLLWKETRTYVPTVLKFYADFQTKAGIF